MELLIRPGRYVSCSRSCCKWCSWCFRWKICRGRVRAWSIFGSLSDVSRQLKWRCNSSFVFGDSFSVDTAWSIIWWLFGMVFLATSFLNRCNHLQQSKAFSASRLQTYTGAPIELYLWYSAFEFGVDSWGICMKLKLTAEGEETFLFNLCYVHYFMTCS